MGHGVAEMELFGNSFSLEDLKKRTGDLSAFAGIREVVLDNGAERGVRMLIMRNAVGLELEVLVDRAFDLGGARFAGVPFGWRSGNGYRHPGLHESDAEGGLSWLRAIDGLLVTGGLDHALFGGEYDASHYHYPPKKTVTHGLHGRLTAIPARLLEVTEDWQANGGVLRVTGEVIQATSFGEHLKLTRTIEMDIAGCEIRLKDVVTNLGFERTPHMFLYHFNFGFPFVDEGSQVIAAVPRHLWESDSVAAQGASYKELIAPKRHFVEQVWEHELTPDAENRHRVVLARPDGVSGVEVTWNAETMPCFFEWQNLREGQYALGLEPSTNHVTGEAAARKDGSLTWLENGDSREYDATIRILTSTDEVTAATAAIQEIGGQP